MEVGISNNVFNIATLQQKMETTVFDYIDSKPNWPVAYQKLNELFEQAINYFNQYLAANEGTLPKVNTYWTLYLNTVSHLIYFTALAKENIEAPLTEEAKNRIAKAYRVALECLPPSSTEEGEQFLQEIVTSYAALTGETLTATTSKGEERLIAFYEFAKKWA